MREAEEVSSKKMLLFITLAPFCCFSMTADCFHESFCKRPSGKRYSRRQFANGAEIGDGYKRKSRK